LRTQRQLRVELTAGVVERLADRVADHRSDRPYAIAAEAAASKNGGSRMAAGKFIAFTTPETRLADNAMAFNPAAADAMVQLMWGALVPGREGSLVSARLRYFDPVRRRAGVPEDVGA
jgi:hypothetical protein